MRTMILASVLDLDTQRRRIVELASSILTPRSLSHCRSMNRLDDLIGEAGVTHFDVCGQSR
ncbi:hypothetical protein, partial [Paraburkholderia sp. RL17-347-BIC-D]|uniref:hypothetical protein n=1 Tax=Paraburkholderia sp. RL17-347-BIC-D TaxID=3031632 RepID=UPI0038B8D4AC